MSDDDDDDDKKYYQYDNSSMMCRCDNKGDGANDDNDNST